LAFAVAWREATIWLIAAGVVAAVLAISNLRTGVRGGNPQPAPRGPHGFWAWAAWIIILPGLMAFLLVMDHLR
jgi:hypothetical protein